MTGLFEPDNLFAAQCLERVEISLSHLGSHYFVVTPEEKVNRNVDARRLFEKACFVEDFLPKPSKGISHALTES